MSAGYGYLIKLVGADTSLKGNGTAEWAGTILCEYFGQLNLIIYFFSFSLSCCFPNVTFSELWHAGLPAWRMISFDLNFFGGKTEEEHFLSRLNIPREAQIGMEWGVGPPVRHFTYTPTPIPNNASTSKQLPDKPAKLAKNDKTHYLSQYTEQLPRHWHQMMRCSISLMLIGNVKTSCGLKLMWKTRKILCCSPVFMINSA